MNFYGNYDKNFLTVWWLFRSLRTIYRSEDIKNFTITEKKIQPLRTLKKSSRPDIVYFRNEEQRQNKMEKQT